MTNEEAIETLKQLILQGTDERLKNDYKALDLAIKALEERPQGEWIVFYTPKKKKVFKCDKCMAVSIQGQTNFCPNCGADMKGDNNG